MNNNIGTMKRVRRTHAKFADLNRNNSSINEDGGESPGPIDIPGEAYGAGADADVAIDERPWKPQGSGIEIGEANADACLGWMTGKVLEHAGFQGAFMLAMVALVGWLVID
jgi:transcriptional activator SPT7